MGTLVCTAVIPAQPGLPQYSPSALATYPNWTRAAFLAQFGVQAPPFDASKAVKLWFATDATAFNLYDSNSQKIGPITLSAADAAAVNLPGAYSYAQYVSPANVASFNFQTGPVFITAGFVSAADAAALAKATGGTVAEAVSPVGGPYTYADPASKLYLIVIGGKQWSASFLMSQWTAAGVGHSGKWDFTGAPLFTADPDYTSAQANTPPQLGFPVRDLLPTEQLRPGLSATVARSDMQPPSSPDGGSFTDADRAMLMDAHSMLARLLAWNHVG